MPLIWYLGRVFSIDKMTMGFKGNHQDIGRLTYKAGGEGFQENALCQDGFTYAIHMINDPAPKQYLRQSLSPLSSLSNE